MELAEQSQSIHLLFLQVDPTGCQVLSVESWQNLTIKDQRIQKNGSYFLFIQCNKGKFMLYVPGDLCPVLKQAASTRGMTVHRNKPQTTDLFTVNKHNQLIQC